MATGEEIKRLDTDSPVIQVKARSDHIIVICESGTLYHWLPSEDKSHHFSLPFEIELAAFDGTGQQILVAEGDAIHTIDFPPSGPPRAKLIQDTSNRVRAISISPDGNQIAIGETSHVLLLHQNNGEWQLNYRLQRHHSDVLALAFSQDGKRLFSGGDDASVRIWDTMSGREVMTIRHSPWRVTCVAQSPNMQLVGAAFGGGEIVLWDTVQND